MTVAEGVKQDMLVQLSMNSNYEDAYLLISMYEEEEEYEACQGIMEAIDLISNTSMPNCKVKYVYPF